MRTKCAISDAFVRDCVFAYCASVAQYVYSPSAEHYFRLRNSAISDERVRDCALSTHSVFRPLDRRRPAGVQRGINPHISETYTVHQLPKPVICLRAEGA